ncbi:MAG: hypothetical protein LUE13_07770, partial [Akkermansiaceae bacterium]|nr:hypothetical protein [Akkermansiaceae bacterium]
IRFNPQEVQKTSQGIEKTLKYRAARKNEYISSAKLQLVQFNKEIDCTQEDGHTGDRGRISEISLSPLPIIWGQESIANSIKTQDVNPTKKVYIVAVHVQLDSKNKPIAYYILELKVSYTPRVRQHKKTIKMYLFYLDLRTKNGECKNHFTPKQNLPKTRTLLCGELRHIDAAAS